MKMLIVLAIPLLLIVVPCIVVEMRRNRGTFDGRGRRNTHADRLERTAAETRTYMERHGGAGL